MVIPLNYIQPQQEAQIVWLASPPDMARRLMDLGFEPEERISCVLKGRKNGMSAYLVNHAVIALRSKDAAGIFVKILPSSPP